MKKILIVGNGGREHALGWKLGQSEEVSEVIFAPGNAGTSEGKGRNLPIDGTKSTNFRKLTDLVFSENVDMVIVGSETSLAEGIVDYFNSKGYNRIFGPTKKATLLESDKFFSFDLMNSLKIPQAESIKCFTIQETIKAINEIGSERGVVIKARGLTGGKGVTVFDSKEEAIQGLASYDEKYGSEVLVAERLFGEEFSVFGISDGTKILPLEIPLQDHKPLLDGDKGPNTGGMGAYGPAPIASRETVRKISEEIMNPMISKMKSDGHEYKGFLYAGMIMTKQGPKVIEFNARFGDPECQPAMMLINEGLYESLSLALEGKLDQANITFNPGSSCCVVLASKGYPNSYEESFSISGLEKVDKMENIKVFHAGTKLRNERILTKGGRVLGVTSYSPQGIIGAQKLVYEAISKINIPGGFHYRKDIADKALGKNNET